MTNWKNERVLTRAGARELTPEELPVVSGGDVATQYFSITGATTQTQFDDHGWD